MIPVYTYETLGPDQIRLLSLFPESDGEDLAGILETVTLKSIQDTVLDDAATISTYEAPQFKALSYCWGRDVANAQLWLPNTKSGTTRPYLPIKPNLASALKKLRRSIRPNEKARLWIDAICINQADIPERNGQIKKMAEIYSAAMEVHIWLGDEEDKSDLAMEFARQIKDPNNFQKALKGDGDRDRSGEWLAFHKLIHRNWFSRRWIVQEISLARTAIVHCGDESISWDELEEAVSFLSAKQNEVRNQVRGSKQHGNPFDALGEIDGTGALHLVEIASNVVQRTPTGDLSVMEHRLSLEALMSSLTMFETSDPYDVVNALLWLAHDVKPDAALSDVNVSRTPVSSPLVEKFTSSPAHMRPPSRSESFFSSRDSTTTTLKGQLAVNTDARLRGRKASVSDVLRIEEQKQSGTTEKLVVDYNMSLFECYKKFLEHVFRRSKSLDIICRAWALNPKKEPPDGASADWKAEGPLPTWMKTLPGNKVFDMNPAGKVCERVRADPLVGKPGIGPRAYNACGKRKHEGSYTVIPDGDRRLTVRGFTLGDIRECGDAANKGNIPEEWLATLGWTSQPNGHDGSHSNPPRSHDRPNWLWRFLVAERGHDGYQPPPMRFRSICTWLLDHRTQGNGLGTDFRDSWPLVLRDFVDRVRAVVWGRRLITIRYGSEENMLFGMAPKEAKVNDIVCILFGCSVPVVLRRSKIAMPPRTVAAPIIAISEPPDVQHGPEPDPKKPRIDTSVPKETSDPTPRPGLSALPRESKSLEGINEDPGLNDGAYEFIGECYVYGMMAGEAFKHRQDHKIPNRFWTLV